MTLKTAWQTAGQNWRTAKRILNPTVSQLHTLFTKFGGVKGGERRTPRILVIGDDGGKVDYAVKTRVGGPRLQGSKTVSEAQVLVQGAIQAAKASVGKPGAQKLTAAEWKKALADPKNWRLLSLLPAAVAAGAGVAEAADGTEGEGQGLGRYLPMLATLGVLAGGAKAYKMYRNRPVTVHAPLGQTKVQELAARQKTALESRLRPKPIEEPTGRLMRKKVQQQFALLEDEQAKHPGLFPHQRAWDIWSKVLGGGGGAVDAAVHRIGQVWKMAEKEGVSDQLVDELNIRGMERASKTIQRHVVDTESAIIKMEAQLKAVEKQKAQAPSGTLKMNLGKQASKLHRQLVKERQALSKFNRENKALQAGLRLPGGLTPAGVAAEKLTLGRGQGRVAQLASYLYQEARQVMDEALREGVIDKDLYDKVMARDEGYVNLAKHYEQVTTTRAGRIKAQGTALGLDVPTDTIVRVLQGSGDDPIHPMQALTKFLRNAQGELARQKATRAMVELVRLDPANRVKLIRVDRNGLAIGPDLAYLRKHNMRPVTYLQDGKAVHYAVPNVFAALADVAGETPKEAEAFWKALGKVRGWSQMSMTTLQAPFLVANMLMDVSTAGKFLPEAYNRLDPVDTVNRYKEWALGVGEVWRKSPEYQQFMEEGASYSGFTKALDPAMYHDIVDASVLGKRHRVLGTVKQAMNAVEDATKFMTWKRLKAKGFGELDRVTMTRRYGGSPDFWQSGEWSRGLGTLLLFFNPGVQGIHQSVTGLKRGGNYKYLAAGAVGGAVALQAWNSQFTDKDGKLELYNIDERTRANNFVWINPWETQAPDGTVYRDHWRIPKPHISRLLYYPIEKAMEASETGAVDVPAAINAFASQLLPMNAGFELESPTSLTQSVAASLNPALRIPLGELPSDKQWFTGRPIEGKAFADIPGEERFRDSTGMAFRDFGRATKWLRSMGGDERAQGLSPLMTEYAAKGFLPGPVDIASDLYDLGGSLMGREMPQKPGGALPVVSSLAKRFTGGRPGDARIQAAREVFYQALADARMDAKLPKPGPLAGYASMLESQAETLADWRKMKAVVAPKARAGDARAQRTLKQINDGEALLLSQIDAALKKAGKPKPTMAGAP